jgi:GTP-binding protein
LDVATGTGDVAIMALGLLNPRKITGIDISEGMLSRRRWEQMIENYLRKRENLTMVFVLIDARHSPQKIDLEFLENLKIWQIPFSLVFTKSDKENQRTVSKNVKDFLEAMKKNWQFLPQHFVTSAIKKTGRKKILDLIHETNVELSKVKV